MAFHLYKQKKKKAEYDFHPYVVTKEQRVLQSYCRGYFIFFLETDVSVKSQMSLNGAKTEDTHHPYLSSSWQMWIPIILPFHKQILSE